MQSNDFETLTMSTAELAIGKLRMESQNI